MVSDFLFLDEKPFLKLNDYELKFAIKKYPDLALVLVLEYSSSKKNIWLKKSFHQNHFISSQVKFFFYSRVLEYSPENYSSTRITRIVTTTLK